MAIINYCAGALKTVFLSLLLLNIAGAYLDFESEV